MSTQPFSHGSIESLRDFQAREMLADLYRLIEALDRRVPRLERMGEGQITHDANDLRERALSLIHRIEGAAPKQ